MAPNAQDLHIPIRNSHPTDVAMVLPKSPMEKKRRPDAGLTNEEKKLVENIRKIMKKAAELTQERARTDEKYRNFLAAEATLKKQIAVEKAAKAANKIFLAEMAESDPNGEAGLGNGDGEGEEEDKLSLMDDDWLVIDGIEDWDSLVEA